MRRRIDVIIPNVRCTSRQLEYTTICLVMANPGLVTEIRILLF